MHLRYLQYLRLVIEHGSFAAAAQAGGVSQPAISHGMRQLQRLFDAPLFTRSGRRLLPTEAALQAALKSAELAERVEALATARATPAPRDTLRAGVTPSAALVFGPALHAGWCEGHPKRRLNMISADEGRMLASLQGGDLDLVIAPRPRGHPATGLACEPLYQLTPLGQGRLAGGPASRLLGHRRPQRQRAGACAAGSLCRAPNGRPASPRHAPTTRACCS